MQSGTESQSFLVTGGAGFVGQHVVAALAARGHRVRVLTRARRNVQPPSPAVEFHEATLLEPASLPRSLDGVDVVVHLAAALSGPDVYAVNVGGTEALARAARAAGIRRFVHCSSGGVYGDGSSRAPHRETDEPRPQSPYERSKLEGERAVQRALGDTVPWVVLRPAGVYGPGRRATADFFRAVKRRSWFVHGPATVIVHPTYLDDVVNAILAVVQRPELAGGTFNVGGSRALTYIDLIDAVAVAMNRRVRHLRVPAATRQIAALLQRIGILPTRFERLTRPLINRALDTSRASQVLGLHPLPLEQGIERTLTSLRERGAL